MKQARKRAKKRSRCLQLNANILTWMNENLHRRGGQAAGHVLDVSSPRSIGTLLPCGFAPLHSRGGNTFSAAPSWHGLPDPCYHRKWLVKTEKGRERPPPPTHPLTHSPLQLRNGIMYLPEQCGDEFQSVWGKGPKNGNHHIQKKNPTKVHKWFAKPMGADVENSV